MSLSEFYLTPVQQYPYDEDLRFCWCFRPLTTISLFHAVSYGRHQCLICGNYVLGCGEHCEVGCDELQRTLGRTFLQLMYIKIMQKVRSIVL